MRDPELTCEVGPDGTFHPVRFTQDKVGAYHEAVFVDQEDRPMVRPRAQKDLAAFARQWDKNLKEQGFLDAARAEAGRGRMRAEDGPRASPSLPSSCRMRLDPDSEGVEIDEAAPSPNPAGRLKVQFCVDYPLWARESANRQMGWPTPNSRPAPDYSSGYRRAALTLKPVSRVSMHSITMFDSTKDHLHDLLRDIREGKTQLPTSSAAGSGTMTTSGASWRVSLCPTRSVRS